MTHGAIGYVQLSAARQHQLPAALLENREGRYVAATLESSVDTLRAMGMPKDLRAWMPDPLPQTNSPFSKETGSSDPAHRCPSQARGAIRAAIRHAATCRIS